MATRPCQSMNVMIADVVRTSKDYDNKGEAITHRDTNNQKTSQGNADEGESLPLPTLAIHGPADTLTERSDLMGPLEEI